VQKLHIFSELYGEHYRRKEKKDLESSHTPRGKKRGKGAFLKGAKEVNILFNIERAGGGGMGRTVLCLGEGFFVREKKGLLLHMGLQFWGEVRYKSAKGGGALM